MKNAASTRPGTIIFLSGVVLLVTSTALGFHLSKPRRSDIPPLDWHLPGYDDRLEAARTAAAEAEVSYSSNVNALMWIVFGLGVTLTLLGLRLMTEKLPILEPESPIKPIHRIFEP